MKIRGEDEDWDDTFMFTVFGFIVLVLLGIYVWLALVWWPLMVGVPIGIFVAYAIGRFAVERWLD